MRAPLQHAETGAFRDLIASQKTVRRKQALIALPACADATHASESQKARHRKPAGTCFLSYSSDAKRASEVGALKP